MIEIRISYSPDVIDRIGNYLAQRPWAEVNSLLADLQTKGIPVEAPLVQFKPADYSDVSVDSSVALAPKLP
jgi:hypothetical protein